MSGKQLYSKTNSNYEEITPLTYIQNVIDENSKNSLDKILKIYNHIYIEFENNNTITRNKVPKELRRCGLTITYYDNINNKLITERFNRNDNVASSNTAWLLNKHWDTLLYDSDIFKKGIKVHIPNSSITINMLSDSLKQLFENKKGVIINYPDEEDLTIQKSTFNYNTSVLQFKDRNVDPINFISEGIKVIRRRFSPVKENTAEANGTYIFNDFINIDGCQDNSVLYIDNDILTLANDDIIVYDVYNHRFCARSYKTIDNVQKTVYYVNWKSSIDEYGDSIDYNNYNKIDNKFYPLLNNIYICSSDHKKYYFTNEYNIEEVVNEIYTSYKNIITQKDFDKQSTKYIIKYDFDLNGKTINIPEDCTLVFNGGKLKNGIIKLNKTFIEGAIKDINEYLPENTSPNFGDGQIIYNYKELHICKVQEDGTSVMFTIQTKQ